MENQLSWGILTALIPLFLIWSFIWKGMALWRAAQNNSKPWFVVLLLVNTMGILEILYLYVFSKNEESGNNV